MSGLRSDHLNELALKTLNNFSGIFPCDIFKTQKLINNKNFICNLSTSSRPGSHWIAICVKNNNIYYFDSFGKKSFKDKNIMKNLKSSKKKIYVSKNQIQALGSLFCGYHAVAFLILSERYSNPIKQLEKCYDKTNLTKNEQISKNIILQALRKQ